MPPAGREQHLTGPGEVAVRRLAHRHATRLRQAFGEVGGEGGGHVLDHEDWHASVGNEGRKHLGKRGRAAGGYRDHDAANSLLTDGP